MNLPVHSFNIYDMIKRNASLFSTSAALIHGDKTVTFQEYLFEVNALACAISLQGVQPGDRIAILAMNCSEYLVLYGATAALGAVLVPLNWRLAEDELSYILGDSDSQLLFFDETQKELACVLKNSVGFKGKLIAITDQDIDVPSSFSFNASEILRYEEMRSRGKEEIKEHSEWQLPISNTRQDEQLFCLIYTAAVEGNPRGAALSHSNIIAANIQTCLTMHLDGSDAYLNMLPLFHITGMNLSLAAMHMGGRNVIMEKFDAARALDLVESEKITLMASFPPILNTLTETLEGKNISMQSLKNVVGIDSPDNIHKFTE